MSPPILVLTVVLLAVPLALLLIAACWSRLLLGPALLTTVLYAWVWLRFRPTAFVLHPRALEVIWPLKRRQIPRAEISAVRLIDRNALRREAGPALRVGAGGLWGGFGCLWTTRRGLVRMYVSRTDGLVWIERGSDRPWLLTPDRPATFVRALSTLPGGEPS